MRDIQNRMSVRLYRLRVHRWIRSYYRRRDARIQMSHLSGMFA